MQKAQEGILQRHEWHDTSFRGASLVAKNLRWRQFFHCDFTDADLSAADLTGAKFWNCRFVNAKMVRVVAVQTDFTRANFSGACLDWGHLDYATLDEATLRGVSARAVMCRSVHALHIDGTDADFSDSTFRPILRAPTVMRASVFTRARLQNTDLMFCDLANSKFDQADLTGATLNFANAQYGDFRGAQLDGVKCGSTNVLGALGKVATASFGGYVAVVMGRSVSIGSRTAGLYEWLERGAEIMRKYDLSEAEITAYLAWLQTVASLLAEGTNTQE